MKFPSPICLLIFALSASVTWAEGDANRQSGVAPPAPPVVRLVARGGSSSEPSTFRFGEVATRTLPAADKLKLASELEFSEEGYEILTEEQGETSDRPANTEEALPCGHCRGRCRCNNFQEVAPWARPTYGKKYVGYYVGGGRKPKSHRYPGEGRNLTEGTWGMDYEPWYSRVQLQWTHGRLYQGGVGQYEQNHKNHPFGQFVGRNK